MFFLPRRRHLADIRKHIVVRNLYPRSASILAIRKADRQSRVFIIRGMHCFREMPHPKIPRYSDDYASLFAIAEVIALIAIASRSSAVAVNRFR